MVLADRSGVAPPTDQVPPTTTYASAWKPTPADVERGFAAYAVDTSADLIPDWVWPEPCPEGDLRVFSCPDQYSARAIAVRTLGPVAGLRPVASDLRSAKGKVLPADSVDIRMVQFLPFKDRDRLLWHASWLERPFPTDLAANRTAWLWVTFCVPAEAAPGLYQGTITLRNAAGRSVGIPVALRVLDFKLQRPAGSWGMYIPGHFFHTTDGEYVNYASDESWRADNLQRYFRFWKTRGLNSPTLYHIYPDLRCVDGHTVAGFADVSRFAQAMKAAGSTGDLCLDLRFIEFWAGTASRKLEELGKAGKPTDGDTGVHGPDGEEVWEYGNEAKRLFQEAVTQLLAVAEREHWPPLRLLVEEEVGYPTRKTATYDAFIGSLLQVAPDRAYIVDNAIGYGLAEAIDRGARDDLRVRQYNNRTEEGLADARQHGAQVWSYNMGFSRGAWGFYQQRFGSQGYHQWADQWDPGPEWRQCLITPDGVLSTVNLERAREGRDDHAFCHTLSLLADRLVRAGRAKAAGAARQVLSEVAGDLPTSRYPYFDWEARLAPGEWDQRRWRLVLAIEEARRALAEKPTLATGTQGGTPAIVSVASRAVGSRLALKTLYAPFCTAAVKLDGKLDETCWASERNSTGSLWWTWETEAAMRARAGSLDEFERMPRPSAGHAQVAYGEQGLYLAVACNHATQENCRCTHGDDDGNLWEDDCMEFFFAPSGTAAGFFHLIVNVRGKRVLMRYSEVVPNPGIQVATTSPINASGGYSQEIVVPWQALGLAHAPEPGAVWPMNVGREFNSWNQITSWAAVNSMFAETDRWGLLAFAGTPGPVAVEGLELGSRYPGRNLAEGTLRVVGTTAAGALTVSLDDSDGKPLARAEVQPPAPFALEYTVPSLREDATWRLRVLGPDGKALTEVPVRIPAAGPSLSLDRVPARVVAGEKLVVDLTARVGDLTASECKLTGELSPASGRPVKLAGAPLGASQGLRAWLDTVGLKPGRWTLRLWVEGAGLRDSGAKAPVEILPSPMGLVP